MNTLFPYNPIRALTWKEPYASLMAFGKIETRNWATTYTGDVLICCGKTPYTEKQLLQIAGKEQLERIKQVVELGNYQHLGKAIGVAKLTRCRMMWRSDEDKTFVQYTGKLYSHIYENFRPIRSFDFRGQQGWKKLPESIWDQIDFLDFENPCTCPVEDTTGWTEFWKGKASCNICGKMVQDETTISVYQKTSSNFTKQFMSATDRFFS